jgi:Kdo2-lipid IVA lauroyltransferase/acyltransferase
MPSMTARSRVAERVEAAVLSGVVRALQWLPPVAASNFGGWLARSCGPWLPISRVADSNLRPALPELDAAGRARVIRGVWDNLGRNVAELPHLANFRQTDTGPGWEVEGTANIAQLRASGASALFFSGHFGNWELILPIAAALGLHASGFYRAASNVAVDRLIQSLRQRALAPGMTMFPKGAQGARSALLHLQGGGSLGLLIDQKMNDGIAVRFFGRDAMTAPALAQFALRFDVPIMPVHVVRLGPARFRMVCDPPLDVVRTGDKTADIHAITLAVNQTLERWIRADPSSWLWLHRRWPKSRSRSL